jgi:hypothetical protein
MYGEARQGVAVLFVSIACVQCLAVHSGASEHKEAATTTKRNCGKWKGLAITWLGAPSSLRRPCAIPTQNKIQKINKNIGMNQA